MIRDRLVCGITNEKSQQCLLVEDNLTYDKAYKLLLLLEASEREVKDISREKQIHQTAHTHPRRAPNLKMEGGHPAKTKTKPCYPRGGAHNCDKCTFRDAECRYCHKKGHIAAAQRLHVIISVLNHTQCRNLPTINPRSTCTVYVCPTASRLGLKSTFMMYQPKWRWIL